ncbi:MAG: hypothetical protein HZA54_15625 [Planctomycetes bacterium]|nr:hypothetical protein [Planctomycetota bacterium]
MDQLRLDLNGIPLLAEEAGQVICLFRYRSRSGLILGLPEEGDVSVPWSEIESATIDLGSGTVQIRFTPEAVGRHAWLRQRRAVAGTWLDRHVKDGSPGAAS